jgi:methionyl-tRNA formyltransferase
MMQKTRLIFCSYSSVYSSVVLQKLLEARQIEVVGIVNSTRVLKKNYGFVRGAIELVRLTGWRYVLYQLWLTDFFHLFQPFSTRKTIQNLAKKHRIPVHSTRDINSDASVRFIRSTRPDLLVSAYFNQLIKPQVMALPTHGCINIHPSLLPQLRGADPVFHGLLRGNKALGVTVHYLGDEFDTGNILSQKAFHILPGASVLTHYTCLFEHGAQMSINAISQIQTGWRGTPQSQGDDYVSWPTRQNVKDFVSHGHHLMSLKAYFAILMAGPAVMFETDRDM